MIGGAPMPAGERLVQAGRCLSEACTGEHPIWAAALALEHLIVLFGEDSQWRIHHGHTAAELVNLIGPVVSRVHEEAGERIVADKIYLGLGSAGALLLSSDPTYPEDRIGHVRILLCELAILLQEAEIASRGDQLVCSIRALSRSTATAPSNMTIH